MSQIIVSQIIICHSNFEGSSGAMDAAGCVAIFERSVEQYGLRYTAFLGDGDSKAFNLVTEKDVYEDVKVTKLECVGHVQKRTGSRLRSLKKRSGKTHLDDGKPIGGRGRLTDNVIDSMQVYYGKAIRKNTHSFKAMQDATWAIWCHMQSADENPDHSRCPVGEDSWCGFQRDFAKKHQRVQGKILFQKLWQLLFSQYLMHSLQRNCSLVASWWYAKPK